MKMNSILTLVLMIGARCATAQPYSSTEVRDECPKNSRINLTGGKLDPESEWMAKSGYVFPDDSRWEENNDTFGCACYSKSICSPVYCPNGNEMYLQIDRDCKKPFYDWIIEPSDVVVYTADATDDQLDERTLVDYESVAMMNHQDETSCEWMDSEVKTVKFSTGNFILRYDGGIYLPNKSISTMYNFDRYCLCSVIHFNVYKPTCHSAKNHRVETLGVTSRANLGCDKQWLDFYMNLLILTAIGNLLSQGSTK